MATQLASYQTPSGEPRHIELTPTHNLDHPKGGRPTWRTTGHKLLLDYGLHGPPRVVAELGVDEGVEQALAVLHAGEYLQRARDGEPRLCRTLAGSDPGTPAPTALARAGRALEGWVIPDPPVPGALAA